MTDEVLEIPLAEHKLHNFIWLPLEAQDEAGPHFLCVDCYMSWQVTLPEDDREWWARTVADIRRHMEGHQ